MRLGHAVRMEELQAERFPLPPGRTSVAAIGEAEVASAEALGVRHEHVFLPRFARGSELLVYRDSDHLHRSPRHTSNPEGRPRDAVWRFY